MWSSAFGSSLGSALGRFRRIIIRGIAVRVSEIAAAVFFPTF